MSREKQLVDGKKMVDINSIKIGYGLGDLMFGAVKEECRKYLGDPDDEDTEVFDGEEYLHWYYDRWNIELCFEASENYRLGTIILEHDNALLGTEPIMGKSISEIESYLMKNNYSYAIEVEEMEDDEVVLIDVDDMECTFMFRKNVLEGVQWSYLWVDDDTPQWPKRRLQ
ncbi:MAG: hypothetical protein HQK62_11615 [Desulfamplus sp.]|nr:hypothetical protein [Desulfamplus sp.]MBF0259467.1 hypothetical protein [Desulfamplus sp.]